MNFRWFRKNVDRNFWIIIIVFLAILIPASMFLPIDLRWNLIAEFLGIIASVILLNILLTWKEKYKWELVEKDIYDFFQREIFRIYIEISSFLEGAKGSVVCTSDEFGENEEKNFYSILEEMAKSQKLKLSNNIIKICKQNNYDELFELRRKNLDMLELKYSKFLHPEIVSALVLIEYNLYRAAFNIKRIKKDNNKEHIYLTEFKQNIHNIIKEIHKLHVESKIKIYYLPQDESCISTADFTIIPY